MEANRKNINAAFAKMQQEAKQLGVELLTKPEVFIDDDHLCCVWYGGYIGGFMYKDYTVALEVHGEMKNEHHEKKVQLRWCRALL